MIKHSREKPTAGAGERRSAGVATWHAGTKHLTLVSVATMLGAVWGSKAWAEPPECASAAQQGPMFVTEDCIDSGLNQPVIEVDEWRDTPVRHRYVNGRFEGTTTRFSFYFPPQDRYGGRFFQYTQPAPSGAMGAENTAQNNIEFGGDSGAYYVQTNGGGDASVDVTISGYRADAAAAKFSRALASEMYGTHRPYGYHYGGSGGGFKTISGAEHTSGVWDGSLPFVIGSPMALPNVYSVRANALRVLRRGNRCDGLIDAIEPGGSGDIYAGLNQEERDGLAEATRFGFPPRGWYACKFMEVGALPLIGPIVASLDPTYFTDFWTLPGYLGTDPNSSVGEDRVQLETSVRALVPTAVGAQGVQGLPSGLQLTDVPTRGDFTSYALVVLSGAAAGQTLPMAGLVDGVARFTFTANADVAASIQPGDRVRIDNSDFLAIQTYHRHQVPSRDFYVFDQFRAPDGTPSYPQRKALLGPQISGTGTVQNGRIHGKMILMETMMDIDALPWQADWYRSKVKEYLGSRLDSEFRLYFIDNADHGSEIVGPLNGQIVDQGRSAARLIPYRPVLESILLDLVLWVEAGQAPVASSRYRVDDDGQIDLPSHALLRRGIQAVVHLRANGAKRAEVATGEPVELTADIRMPANAGEIVSVEWDFEGVGDYPVVETLGGSQRNLRLTATHVFSRPGTYYPVLRATSQRERSSGSRWARIANLDRVRVVVE